MLNADKPDGLDGWTLDLPRYELLRAHILGAIDELGDGDDGVLMTEIVALAQERYSTHELFPGGRLRNFVNFTAVDLEARGEIAREADSRAFRLRRLTR